MDLQNCSNGSAAPDTIAEWNAAATGSDTTRRLAFFKLGSRVSSSAPAPLMTVCVGLLRLAITTLERESRSTRCKSIGEPMTAFMPPLPCFACTAMSEPRRSDSLKKSASATTPAAASAVSSP